jgi:hypothetical protein
VAEAESLDAVDSAYDEKIAIRKDFPETFIWDKIDEYAKEFNSKFSLVFHLLIKILLVFTVAPFLKNL